MATDVEFVDIKRLLAMAQENAFRASENANLITAAFQAIGQIDVRLKSNESAAKEAYKKAHAADEKAKEADEKAVAARNEASAASRKVSDDEIKKQFTRVMAEVADSVIRERLWMNGKPIKDESRGPDSRMTIGDGWGDKRGTIMVYFAHHRIDMSVPRDGHPKQTMANYWGSVFAKTVRDIGREDDLTRTNARYKKDQENIYPADLLAMCLTLFRTTYPTFCDHLILEES